jgi:HD-like signal output (HDOD) protein
VYNEFVLKEIDIADFYQKVLMPLSPAPEVSKILNLVMGGGETTEDFAQVLALDAELQQWVRLTVQRLGFEKRVGKLSQAVILLGQNRIRDLILGRHIERRFVPSDKTVLAKTIEDIKKAKEKEKSKNSPTKKPIKKENENTEGQPSDESKPDVPAAEMEIIPQISDYKVYLEYAARAEEITIAIRNSYPGQAFAGGVIFDFVNGFLKTVDTEKVKDKRLKKTSQYVEDIFKDGIRCGIAADEITQKISIPHQKNVFVSALIHNIGKALMLAYDPVKFEAAFLASTGSDDQKKKMTSDESEEQFFGWDHAQLGSLYIGRLPFLVEIERSIDYHHHPHLLKFANPKLYALAVVLRVSGALAKIYQRTRLENPNVEGIKDQKLLKSSDFAFLKLTENDWAEIKSNYVLKLMKVGY